MPPLTYTTDPPTQPGWYWLREPGGEPQLQLIQQGYRGLFFGFADYISNPANMPPGTQWAGPIPRPVESKR